MPPLRRTYDQGLVTSRDRNDLAPGEMQVATGIYYKRADPRAWKIPGRSEFGDTSSAAKIQGVALCQFDSGTDQVVALSDGTLYGATPGLTGTFASLAGSLSGDSLDAAHANDRWYLVTGEENKVLESDNTVRAMGMVPPIEAPVLVTKASADSQDAAARPTAGTTFTDAANCYDTSKSTFGYLSLAAAGTSTGTFSTWASSTGTSEIRRIYVRWSVASTTADILPNRRLFSWVFKKLFLGATATVKFEYSINSGSDWTTFAQETVDEPVAPNDAVSAVFASGVNLNTVQVRATLTYADGKGTKIWLRVHDVRVQDYPDGSASGQADFDGTSIKYAYTEYDATRGLESAPSPIAIATDSTMNATVLTLPGTAQNATATHWRVYRTPDNGTAIQLGLIGVIDIGQTTYVDDFDQYDEDDQPSQLLPYLQIEAEGSIIERPRNSPPPGLRRINYFKGGMVGLTDSNVRGLYYSPPGFPEYWPDLNVIEAFPFSEHDTLVDIQEVDGSLIIAAKALMIRLDEVPRSVAGTFIASPAVQIAGAPGCVGDYAMAAVPYGGRSHVAWISPEDGVLVTDGHSWRAISDDLDWSDFEGVDKSGWVLHYIKALRVLVMSDPANTRYWLLHLHESHIKQSGQAKATGPHYGKISDMASGQVSNTTRIYTGHNADGKVYLDFNSATGGDASQSYSGTTWPLILTSGRRYENWSGYEVHDARLRHTDFGSGQTCTVDYKVGRDASGEEFTRSQTVALNGHKGTQFDIARSGEWHEETITHTGTGLGAVQDLTIRADRQGDEGEASTVN